MKTLSEKSLWKTQEKEKGQLLKGDYEESLGSASCWGASEKESGDKLS